MKKYFLLSSLLLLMNAPVEAQINVHVSLPVWGPVVTTEEYYYLPEIDSYYDIRRSQFIYLNNGYWIRSRNLPSWYRNYNLNKGHVVVINDYRGSRPYTHFRNNKLKYYRSNSHWKGNKNVNYNRNHSKGKENRNRKSD
jgi:hypothetical protein